MIPRIAGIIFILAGIGVGGILPFFISHDMATIQELSPLTMAQIEHQTVGATVLVEGRVSAKNPVQFADFVAYDQERPRETSSRSSTESDRWENDITIAPPLTIDLAEGSVRVTNPDYILSADGRWQEVDMPEGHRRIVGLRADDPVVVISTLQGNNDGVQLEASVVAAGTKASYLAGQRFGWWMTVGLGALSFVVGIVLLIVFRQVKVVPQGRAADRFLSRHGQRKARQV